MMNPASRLARAVSAAAMAGCVMTGLAGTTQADDYMTVRGALGDIKDYYTAPLRWDGADWLAFGGSIAAVLAAHSLDERVRGDFAKGPGALNGGEDKNSLRDALPTVAVIGGTWVAAGIMGDNEGYRETWALIEAGALSTVTGEALSYGFGRERPDATASPNMWGKSGDSFPSVHVSAAFAVGTVFAESGGDEYRWVRRFIGYGIAAGTGYIRMHENVHWLSDTVAGSALGIGTAHFVLHRENGDASPASVSFQPTKNGWMIAYTKRFQ
jgi:membrane-associated phospholipid phosphatase